MRVTHPTRRLACDLNERITVSLDVFGFDDLLEVVDDLIHRHTSELMAHAIYDKLEDGTFSGRIPECIGVLAFGATLRTCEVELRSTLEDWILVGLKLGHRLPVIAGIDLNKGPVREPVDAV